VAPPWALTPGGLRIIVRVTPRSSRDCLDGIGELADGRAVLKVRVRAVPEDGKANAAVVKLIAKALGVAASAARVETGETARLKTLLVVGAGVAELARLANLTATRQKTPSA
jgi:uncharacterized protein (TIGR00251 family)